MSIKAESMEESQPELEQILKNASAIAQKTYEIVTEFMERHQQGGMSDYSGLFKLHQEYLRGLRASPGKVFEMQMEYWTNMMHLWQATTLSWLGQPAEQIIEPSKKDKRFNEQQWNELPVFDFIKQAYLIYSQYIQKLVADLDGLDPKTREQLNFYTKQYVNAISPSNFVATNPEVLNATLHTKGENLVKGLENMLKDIERNKSEFISITMTDMQAFAVGKNLAITPGKVMYQNEMMQLIQYEPSTAQVYQRPLLIIPPWINKYYILDLQPENSFIKYYVDLGHTVFVISWVNPNSAYAKKDFTDYLKQGPLAAIEAIENVTGENSVNALGYCIGGTLLGCTLAYLTAQKKPLIHSATYLAAMLDFENPGDLGVFIDETQLAALEERMQEHGYLDGASMATTFNMLRSNELIWSYFVNNYLLGKEPFPFDILYWNSDNTNLPAAMHSYYLRQFYLKNLLCKPNGITLDNVPINLQQITTPAYFLSTMEDHIAPWKSTYAGALLHSGPVNFTLAGSGHTAGIINAPVRKKYMHWVNKNEKLIANPDVWLKEAEEHPGSWWVHWASWLQQHAGKKVPARVAGQGKLKVIENAPGSYVKVRAAEAQVEQVK